MLGQVLRNRYRIVRMLGQGGTSRVYLAQQLDQDRQVAVKVMDMAKVGEPEFRDLLQREMKFMSRFKHRFAVALYDAVLDAEPAPYLVLEYVPGVSLAQLLERHGRLSSERVGRLLGQLCAVLHAAHNQGLVYRDLKPQNIMIADPDTDQETIKLLDLGLAKLSGGKKDGLYFALSDFSGPQRRLSGTPQYLCPEEIRGTSMDRRGDLYSVGVMLFELLTGKLPFDRPAIAGILEAHVYEQPPTFAECGAADVPPRIQEVVYACLAKDPSDRPQDARALARLYEEALGQQITVADEAVEERIEEPEAAPSVPVFDENAFVCRLTAWMPERIALMKIRGCLPAIGGEVAESEPGVVGIHLYRAVPPVPRKDGGFLARLGFGKKCEPAPAAEVIRMVLHLVNADPAQPNQLSITAALHPPDSTTPHDPEWQAYCERVVRELCAYLMARKEESPDYASAR